MYFKDLCCIDTYPSKGLFKGKIAKGETCKRENNDDHPACLERVCRAKTIRRDAFYSAGNFLKSTSQRENGRPPLRPDVANKTPLHALAKCISMKSARVGRTRLEIARSRFLFVVTLEAGWRTKGCPPSVDPRFRFARAFLSVPVSLSLSRFLSVITALSLWRSFSSFENCESIV